MSGPKTRVRDTRGLTDVATTVPADGQTLLWNDTAGEYQPGDVAASPHALGGAEHTADTLANLNAKVSDATLDDTSDPRDPTVHATTHEPGGTDAMSVDATAGTGSLRTLGTGAQQAAPGDHSHGGSASSFSRNFLTMGG